MDRVGDLAIAVAERIGARVRAHHVEPLDAVDVDEPRALAADIDARALLPDRVGRCEREEAMRKGKPRQFVGVVDPVGHLFLP